VLICIDETYRRHLFDNLLVVCNSLAADKVILLFIDGKFTKEKEQPQTKRIELEQGLGFRPYFKHSGEQAKHVASEIVPACNHMHGKAANLMLLPSAQHSACAVAHPLAQEPHAYIIVHLILYFCVRYVYTRDHTINLVRGNTRRFPGPGGCLCEKWVRHMP
jgi:hypothetical protein